MTLKKTIKKEEHGAGEQGTPELVKKYLDDTPGQENSDAQALIAKRIAKIKEMVAELYGLKPMTATKHGWRRTKVLHKKSGKKLRNTIKRKSNPAQVAIKLKRKGTETLHDINKKREQRQRFLQQYKKASA